MNEEKSEEYLDEVRLPYDMVVAITELLAHLPYGQVFQIEHQIACLVKDQEAQAREPKIITGATP